jgi:hypothetical protein
MEHGAISVWNDAASRRSPIIAPTVNTDLTDPKARSIPSASFNTGNHFERIAESDSSQSQVKDSSR